MEYFVYRLGQESNVLSYILCKNLAFLALLHTYRVVQKTSARLRELAPSSVATSRNLADIFLATPVDHGPVVRVTLSVTKQPLYYTIKLTFAAVSVGLESVALPAGALVHLVVDVKAELSARDPAISAPA